MVPKNFWSKLNNKAEILQAGLVLLEWKQAQMSFLSKTILDGEKAAFHYLLIMKIKKKNGS